MAMTTGLTGPDSFVGLLPAPASPATVSRRRRPAALLDGVLAAACLGAIAIYVVVALLRIRYSFELQWMEGGSVEHVRRLLAGRTIYPPPSVDFASYTYPPLYFWVSAAVAKVTGVGFLPLRLVSFASSLGTMALLAVLVRKEVNRWLPGVVAAGVFAAAFRVTGAWYDVARVDSLFMFLLVAALFTLRRAQTWRGAAGAGAILALSALTKQSAVVGGLPVVAYLLVRRPRSGLAFTAGVAGPLLAISALLNAASSGWYRFSTVDILLGHPIEPKSWSGFPLHDLGRHLWPALAVVAVVALAGRLRRIGAARAPAGARPAGRAEPPWGLYTAAAAGMVGISWISRLHSGGYDDVLIPAVAGVALLFGLAVGRLGTDRGYTAPNRLALVGACLLQLALLAYHPSAQVPTGADVAAGREFLAALRCMPDDVFVVAHPSYAVLAGKPSHAQAAAISDIVRSRSSTAKQLVEASIADAVRRHRFSAIVFDQDDDYRGFPEQLDRYYQRIPAPALDGGPGLRPVTDLAIRPRDWWVSRSQLLPPSCGPWRAGGAGSAS